MPPLKVPFSRSTLASSIIENYGSVSLADYYDLCGVKCDYMDEHYGFVSNDELKKTKIVRCNDGYTHEFSKVMRI